MKNISRTLWEPREFDLVCFAGTVKLGGTHSLWISNIGNIRSDRRHLSKIISMQSNFRHLTTKYRQNHKKLHRNNISRFFNDKHFQMTIFSLSFSNKCLEEVEIEDMFWRPYQFPKRHMKKQQVVVSSLACNRRININTSRQDCR
jgi:hypothetical protein